MDRKLIAIAAEDDRGLQGEVSGHFGRCPYFVLAEVRAGEPPAATVIANPYYGQHRPGVLPAFLYKKGVFAIVAGGMGPRAIAMFNGYGIEVATGAVGNVGKVLDAYLQGELRGTVPCEHDHPESCGGHGHGQRTAEGSCHGG